MADGPIFTDDDARREKETSARTDELYMETGEYEALNAVFSGEEAGLRLDAALAAALPALSRSRVQSLIEEGAVTVNDGPANKSYRVKTGDRADVTVAVRAPLRLSPEDLSLNVVYEDESLIVVDKPKGMVVHPAPGNETGTLVNGLLHHLSRSGVSLPVINGAVRPGIVHRIDKNTSGLIVAAKTDVAHRGLSRQFSEHSIERAYKAIVAGGFHEDAGTVDAPLSRDPSDRKKQRATGGTGRRAVTHWRVVERLNGYCLVELRLETGRTHQIRVHMAHIGRPVLGDDLYGPTRAAAANKAAGRSQYLHAEVLGFDHPVTGERRRFIAPLPDYFSRKLKELKNDSPR
jgi:23S rRNA pseudouridine1911/1915/1917 synthase